MGRIFTELRRRKVFHVATVYAVVAWLLAQAGALAENALKLPDWFDAATIVLLVLGFPVAIVLAWAFEVTPEGLKRETKADPAAPEAGQTGRKLNHIVVAALVLALSYFIIDKVVFNSGRDTAGTSTADQVAQQQPAEIESANADNSIAVLAFVNMSSDEEQVFFSDGLS